MRRLAVLLLAVLLVASAIPTRAQQPSTGYVFPYNLSGQLTYSSYLTSSMWRFSADLYWPDNILGAVVAKVDPASAQLLIDFKANATTTYFTGVSTPTSEFKVYEVILYLFLDNGSIIYYEISFFDHVDGNAFQLRYDEGSGDVMVLWGGRYEPYIFELNGTLIVNLQTGDVTVRFTSQMGGQHVTGTVSGPFIYTYSISGASVEYVAVAFATQITNTTLFTTEYPSDPAYVGEINWWSYTPGSEPVPSTPVVDTTDQPESRTMRFVASFSGATPTPYIVSGSAGYTGVTASYTPTIIDIDIPPAGGPGFDTPAAILMAGLFIVVFILYYRETGKVGVSLFLSSSLSASFMVIATQSIDFMPPLVIISIAGLLLHAGGR